MLRLHYELDSGALAPKRAAVSPLSLLLSATWTTLPTPGIRGYPRTLTHRHYGPTLSRIDSEGVRPRDGKLMQPHQIRTDMSGL